MRGEKESVGMSNHMFCGVVRALFVIVLVLGFASTPVYAQDPTTEVKPGPDDGADEPAEQGETEVNEARDAAITEFNEGVAALDVEDLPTALVHFRQASKIDPDFPDAARATAAVAMELEDFQTAADAAENLFRLQPDNADAIGTAYFAELLLGDVDRLIPSARRLAEVNPLVVSNEMLQHTRVLFDDNLLDGSRSLLEIIIEHEPELAAAYFQLGLTCNMLGDAECTKRALGKFLELSPDDPDAEAARSLLEYVK
jgi:tetratricopeptide (TPR) repeat protein